MTCQKCRAPLKLDQSLESLNPASFDLLIGSPRSGREPNSVGTPSRLPYPAERLEAYEQAAQDAGSPIFKRSMPAARRGIGPANSQATIKDSAAMSFVILSESQVGPQKPTDDGRDAQLPSPSKIARNASSEDGTPRSLSKTIESHTRLFEILSARSDIDHPICSECTELLFSALHARLNSTTKERDAYVAFLKELKTQAPTAEEVARAQKDLAAAQATEARAFEDLRALEREQAALEDELADLAASERALDGDEALYWRSRNALDARVAKFRDTRDALTAASAHDARRLERLQRTNVYNDTFCISHDGHFGTINGLRLGRLPPPRGVDWAEINAAWGSATLMLATVAERLQFAFRGYVIRPMGSVSRIDRIDYPGASAQGSGGRSSGRSTGRSTAVRSQQQSTAASSEPQQPKITTLELFSSGDLPLGRQILHRRFNEAMVAFLECVQQLGGHVEHELPRLQLQSHPSSGGATARRGERGAQLPYVIERDRINGVSIKLGVATDEAWTSACKYTLTCCKFLLAQASNTRL